jgi:hypothetical protein
MYQSKPHNKATRGEKTYEKDCNEPLSFGDGPPARIAKLQPVCSCNDESMCFKV